MRQVTLTFWEHDQVLVSLAHTDALQSRRWKLAWTCAVLFTDNVGRFAAIKELAARQADLRARRDDAAERLQATGLAAQVRPAR